MKWTDARLSARRGTRPTSAAATSRPTIGVTATPVIDPATNTAYMTHKTYVSGTSGPGALVHGRDQPRPRAAEQPGFPVELQRHRAERAGPDLQPDDRAAASRAAADERRRLRRVRRRLRPDAVAGLGLRRLDRRADQGALGRRADRQRGGHLAVGRRADLRRPGTCCWSAPATAASPYDAGSRQRTAAEPRRVDRAPARAGRRRAEADRLLRAVRRRRSSTPGTPTSPPAASPACTAQYFGTPSIPAPRGRGRQGRLRLPAQPRRTRRLRAGQRRRATRSSSGSARTAASGRARACGRANGGWVYIPTASGGNSAGWLVGLPARLPVRRRRATAQPTLSLQATSSDAFGFASGAPVITSEGTTLGLGAGLDGVGAERLGDGRAAAGL